MAPAPESCWAGRELCETCANERGDTDERGEFHDMVLVRGSINRLIGKSQRQDCDNFVTTLEERLSLGVSVGNLAFGQKFRVLFLYLNPTAIFADIFSARSRVIGSRYKRGRGSSGSILWC